MFKEAGETASHLVSFLSLAGNLKKNQKSSSSSSLLLWSLELSHTTMYEP